MKEHNISEFLDDEDGIHNRREVSRFVIHAISSAGTEMRKNIDDCLKILVPLVVFVILMVIIVYYVLLVVT